MPWRQSLNPGKISFMLKLAWRARKLAAGHHAAVAALKRRRAWLIILAGDASPNLKRDILRHAGNCPRVTFLTKNELGAIVGRNEIGVLVVLDQHFARGLIMELKKDENGGDGSKATG